jgi:S-methylmethionine-dependent homocysteine/selenocysteine methylase
MTSPAPRAPGVLLLDGATGTELQRLGVPVRAPWWTSAGLRTAAGRRVLATVHARYVAAGVDVVTANTFRCNIRALRRAGLGAAAAASFVDTAVGLARAAAAVRPSVLVAGSMAPVEDCYRPDLVPDLRTLRAEHAWLARHLLASGVDLVLVETMNCLGEARTALAAVREAGGRAWVSLVPGAPGRLLSGEPIAAAVAVLEREGAAAVLVNCASPARTRACLRVLADVAGGPLGAYPNVEDRRGIPWASHVDRHLPARLDPDRFAGTVRRWVDRFGVGIAGGCCGTTPEHLAALRGHLAPATVGG